MTDARAGAEEARAGHKQAAAERAVDWIESGMVVGLGSGSTAVFAIRRIGMLHETKLSVRLGTRSGVPVEVLAFGWRSQARYLESLGARVTVRSHPDGAPFATDEGNLILDCAFGPVARPFELAAVLNGRAGIVEHGLFLGLATDLVVAGVTGITHRSRA